MINSHIKRCVCQYLITAILIFLVFFFLRDQLYKLEKIKSISISTLSLISIIFILFQIIQTKMYIEILKTLTCEVTFMEGFGLICLRSFYNYLPLNSGMISNALYLKKIKKLPITVFTGLTIASQFIGIFVYGFVGLILSIIYFLINNYVPLSILLVTLTLVSTSIFAMFIPLPNFKTKTKLKKYFQNIKIGFDQLRKNKPTLILIMSLQFLLLFIMSLRFWLIAKDLDININMITIIYITIFGNILRINTIFPGNLGLREAMAGSVAATFSIDFMSGFLPAAIDHIVAMVIIILLGTYFNFRMLNYSRSLNQEPIAMIKNSKN